MVSGVSEALSSGILRLVSEIVVKWISGFTVLGMSSHIFVDLQ